MGKVFLIAFTVYFTNLHAQYDRPFFNIIGTHNGLPDGKVLSSLQDKFGYLWFGTQQGLVRYDGYQTKLYTFLDDNGEFVKIAWINDLFEDNQGLIWAVIMPYGIYYLDRKKNLFVKATIKNKTESDFDFDQAYDLDKSFPDNRQGHYWVRAADNKAGPKIYLFDNIQHKTESFSPSAGNGYFLPCYRYCDLLKGHSGNIWASADSLLCMFNTESHSFDPYFVLPGKLKEYVIGQIVEDPVNADLLWMTTTMRMPFSAPTSFGEVIQFNIKTKRYKIYTNSPGSKTAIPGFCYKIFTDSLKRLWFGTEGYISLFNYQNESFTSYPLELPETYPDGAPKVSGIAAETDGNLWIGGYFNGLVHLDIAINKVTFFSRDINAETLPSFSAGVNKLFFDRSGVLWVSIPWHGLAYLDLKRSWFNAIKIKGLVKKNAEPSSNPSHVLGKLNDSVFLVSDLSGLFTWDIRNNISMEIEPGERIKNVYERLCIDQSGLVWIPTFGDGLKCYDPVTKKVKTYKHDPKDSASIGSDVTWCIKEDSDKNLWIGTGDNGLNFYNRKTGKFKRYPFIINDGTIGTTDNVLDDRTVLSLHFDSRGILWIGTNLGGANSFDPKTGKFTSYLDFKEGFVCVPSLLEDSQKRLWAGTYFCGLFLFDRDKGLFRRIAESENVSLVHIRDIKEDRKGNILILKGHGLFRLNPNDNSIINCTSIGPNENVLSGLESDNCYIYNDSDHLFYLGVENGIIPFNPGNLFKDTLPPRVVIESIKYQPGGDQKNSSDTTLFLPGTDNIELRYNENKIVFQYTALHYINALSTRYAFKLEGYDKHWVQAGTERIATYTNLSSGTYTFRVKAANNDDVWSEMDAKFTVIILPPWWQTWWFKIIAAACVITSGYTLMRWRLQRKFHLQLERSKNEKQLAELQHQKVELEMQALRAQMNPHFIFNSLNSINRFILQSDKLQASEYLSKFSMLIRLILQNSQATLTTLESELESLQLYLELEKLRFDDHFGFKIIIGDELNTEMIKIPPLIIQPFAENAIWHGLMHKEEKGHLQIELFQQVEMLCCKITDDGVGRKKAESLNHKSTIHKSMGLRITEERIAMLQEQKQINSSVQITDLVLPDGSAGGTEVLLKIPLIIN